jgi:hypothetical protein
MGCITRYVYKFLPIEQLGLCAEKCCVLPIINIQGVRNQCDKAESGSGLAVTCKNCLHKKCRLFPMFALYCSGNWKKP